MNEKEDIVTTKGCKRTHTHRQKMIRQTYLTCCFGWIRNICFWIDHRFQILVLKSCQSIIKYKTINWYVQTHVATDMAWSKMVLLSMETMLGSKVLMIDWNFKISRKTNWCLRRPTCVCSATNDVKLWVKHKIEMKNSTANGRLTKMPYGCFHAALKPHA